VARLQGGRDGAVVAPAPASLFNEPSETEAIIEQIQHSALPSIIDRQRRLTLSAVRPGQAKFRDNIMRAYNGRCAVTGDSIENILEAAHIIPAKNGGSDGRENGLCLRVDIHRLFDSFNIRLRQDGQLHLSDIVRDSPNYGFLPDKIALPAFVNPVNVYWRDTYL
jgi:predicted restriction endonuclease